MGDDPPAPTMMALPQLTAAPTVAPPPVAPPAPSALPTVSAPAPVFTPPAVDTSGLDERAQQQNINSLQSLAQMDSASILARYGTQLAMAHAQSGSPLIAPAG